MKTINILRISLLFFLPFTSCKKESFSDRLVGKWQLKEMYNATVQDFSWSNVPAPNQLIREFKTNGNYKESFPAGSFPLQCSGTYSIQSDREIKISTDCYSGPNDLEISISNNVMTLTYMTREGEIKEKLVKAE